MIRFISHPEVVIDPSVPVPDWGLWRFVSEPLFYLSGRRANAVKDLDVAEQFGDRATFEGLTHHEPALQLRIGEREQGMVLLDRDRHRIRRRLAQLSPGRIGHVGEHRANLRVRRESPGRDRRTRSRNDP